MRDVTKNFELPLPNVQNALSPHLAALAWRLDDLLAWLAAVKITPVVVPYMISDADMGGAPPIPVSAGHSFIVRNWGPGFSDGDIIEWSGSAWVVIVSNVAGNPPAGQRFIVNGMPSGSFAGHLNNITTTYAGGAYSFALPTDGDLALVTAALSIYANAFYVYDDVPPPGAWKASAIVQHNTLAGLQGGQVGQYFHLKLAELTKLAQLPSETAVFSRSTPITNAYLRLPDGLVSNLTGYPLWRNSRVAAFSVAVASASVCTVELYDKGTGMIDSLALNGLFANKVSTAVIGAGKELACRINGTADRPCVSVILMAQ